MRRDAHERRGGFTLMEMMAVVLLMGIVIAFSIDTYLDLSRASHAATTETGEARRAAILLDRIARDLEGATLLARPPDLDPLAWPWLFVAESENPDAGASRVKFVRRGKTPRTSDLPESDLEVVAWVAEQALEGDVELRRASWPVLPPELDRSFPDAEQSDRVASGLASFGILFTGEESAPTGRWDSTTLADSGALPIAAEIEISFLTDEEGVVEGPYRRRVLLPLRPLDLAAKLAEAAGDASAAGEEPLTDEDGDGDIDEDDAAIRDERLAEEAARGEEGDFVSVAECLALNPSLQGLVNADPQTAAVVGASANGRAADFEGALTGLGISFPENCR
jgi:prepilin-type N-terminal cleavage/methylation domain-containing protein